MAERNTAIRGVQIKDAVAAAGLSKDASGNIQVNVDDSSIEVSGDNLQVKASGITNAMLAGSIADDKLNEDYIQTSEVDGTSVEFSGGSLSVVASGITNNELADDAVQASTIDTFNEVGAGVDGYVLTWDDTNSRMDWTEKTSGDYLNESELLKENFSATCDGVEDTFSLSESPVDNSVQVYLNGILLEEGSGKDYDLSGSDVVFNLAPESNDILIVYYVKESV